MFKRKLIALEHHAPDSFNIDDEHKFRSLVLWLEEQKIRHYKVEDRDALRKIDSDDWPSTFNQYINVLACPVKSDKKAELLEWLLGHAVRLEYEDNIDKFSGQTSEDVLKNRQNQPKVVSTNPLDNIDFDSAEFKTGVNTLAQMLKITPHPNHLITLRAISKLVSQRLSSEAIENPDAVIPKGTHFPFQSVDAGFDLGDANVNNAAKMLRLLFLDDIRNMQTHINECIVAVQNLTANPKTDTSLGKVGR